MKKTTVLGALMALVAAPAFAGQAEYVSVQEVAALTGMDVREVQLMTGAYSNNPLYRTSFNRISREWNEAAKEAGLVLEQVRNSHGRVVEVRFRRLNTEV